ncbi:MAG: glycoside hydrolase family 16 protein [Gemmatimonadaceae bacterium]|nr:glycoside hydrolase family 16 protein [Gemmatimonadaceae bacterium]
MRSVVFVVVALIAAAFFVTPSSGVPPQRLVWSDEFSGSVLDSSKWWVTPWCSSSVDDSYICFNAANCVVRGGSLVLRVTAGTGGRPYDACRVQTFREGGWPPPEVKAQFPPPVRVEARIKFAPGAGLWGAFWFMSNTTAAAHLELDVQEFRGAVPREDACHVHGVAEGGAVVDTGQDLSADFHVYWVEYRSSSVRFGIDGLTCGSFSLPNYSAGEMIRFTHQVGPPGTWGGVGGPPPASSIPAEMFVDWVRVYKLRG